MGKILSLVFTLMCCAIPLSSCGHNTRYSYTNLSADEFEQLILNDSVQLADVRTVAEYSEGHIPGSININVLDKQFTQIATGMLDKSFPVAVYCKSGRRSRNAARLLSKEGFKVYNLDKGFDHWKSSGKAIEK